MAFCSAGALPATDAQQFELGTSIALPSTSCYLNTCCSVCCSYIVADEYLRELKLSLPYSQSIPIEMVLPELAGYIAPLPTMARRLLLSAVTFPPK